MPNTMLSSLTECFPVSLLEALRAALDSGTYEVEIWEDGEMVKRIPFAPSR